MCSSAPVVPGVPALPTGSDLMVSLSSDNPASTALVQGQAIGDLAHYTFTNRSSTEAKVTSVVLNRIGVSSDTTLTNVYLYNGAVRLSDSASVTSGKVTFNDASGLFTVAPGASMTVAVKADIAGSTSGQYVGVSLVSVASNLPVSGSLPLSGNTHSVASATIATADFASTTNPTASTQTAANELRLWENTMTVGTRAVWLKAIRFRNIGSINTADIKNFKLFVDGVQVGSAVPMMDANGYVSFDLSAAPYSLGTGGRLIKLQGDIISGSSRTFQYQLRQTGDVVLVDSELGQAVLPTAAGSTFSSRNATSATIDAGTVSVTKANTSRSDNVAVDESNVALAKFEFRAAGEDVKVENLNVQALTSGSAEGGLDNGKVFLNGVQIGSTKDLTEVTDVNFTFGSSFIARAGMVEVVEIYADVKTTTAASYANTDTVQVRLSTGSSNGQGKNSLTTINTPTANVTGNSITVSSSSLTANKNSSYGDQTLLAGTNNAKLGSFSLSAGSSEGVNVNTITVALSADEAATVTDLAVVDASTGAVIGTAKPSPSTSNAYGVNLVIAKSASKTFNLMGNIKSGSNIGPWSAAITAASTGASTGNSASASSVTLQTITVGTGTLTVANGVSPDNVNVIAGATNVKVGSFKFTSQYSDFTVKDIKVRVPANAASSVSSVKLSWYNGEASQTLSGTAATDTHATATFTGLSFVVPANSEKTLDVYVNVSTVESVNGISGNAITVLLESTEGFKATDSSGTDDTSLAAADVNSAATTGKGTMYVRRSVPTISSVSLDSSTLSAGSNKALGRVKVSADAAGDIGWKTIMFHINKTAALTLGSTNTLALWQGSNEIAGTMATSTYSAAESVDAFVTNTSGDLVFTATDEQQIPAGSSATYELRGTVGAIGSGYNFVNVSVPATATSVTTAAFSTVHTAASDTGESFVWSDRSSISTVHSESTADWTNDYLVKTLPADLGTLSVTI
jgi:hypothetical protein